MCKNSGFSLIELLLVIAVIAIICAIAIPNLIGWRNKAQLGRAARDLYGSFQKAKMEATRSNKYCSISFNNITVNGQAYDYVAYRDDSPFNLQYDAGEQIISARSWSEYPGVSNNDGITFPIVSSKPTIAFAPDGLPKDQFGLLRSGSVYLKNQSNIGREIRISLMGNIQITQY
jgi:type IV fimbrial biogenesis protein FimT